MRDNKRNYRHSSNVSLLKLTKKSQNFRYKNVIEAQVGFVRGPISRMRSIQIEFSCEFEVAHTLSIATAVSPSLTTIDFDLGQGQGAYSVDMQARVSAKLLKLVLSLTQIFQADNLKKLG